MATVTTMPTQKELLDTMHRLVEERVARGAAFEDQDRPDWFRTIDMEKFNIRDGEACVLGQVYAKNARAVNGYAWAVCHFGRDEEAWAAAHGFTLDHHEVDSMIPGILDLEFNDESWALWQWAVGEYWAMLQCAWKNEISKRLEAASA